MSTYLPLPNAKWARSTRMPDRALCFDPEHDHHGWQLQSLGGRWVAVARLSKADLERCRMLADLKAHHAEIDKLLAAANDTKR